MELTNDSFRVAMSYGKCPYEDCRFEVKDFFLEWVPGFSDRPKTSDCPVCGRGVWSPEGKPVASISPEPIIKRSWSIAEGTFNGWKIGEDLRLWLVEEFPAYRNYEFAP